MTISLIGILVTLIIIGAILYIIQLLPIDATIKRICKLGQGGQNLQNFALC